VRNPGNLEFARVFVDHSNTNFDTIFGQQFREPVAPLDQRERRRLKYLFYTEPACLVDGIEPVKI